MPLFSVVYNIDVCASELNNYLIRIQYLSYKWELLFTPKTAYPTQGLISFGKRKNIIYFNFSQGK